MSKRSASSQSVLMLFTLQPETQAWLFCNFSFIGGLDPCGIASSVCGNAKKKKVGILRTSGTCMFSGFLSVISDDSLCPHAEYSLSFFFFSALLQFMSPPLSKKEAHTCCDAQNFSGRNLCRWKKKCLLYEACILGRFFDEEGNWKTRGKPSIQVGTDWNSTYK